MPAGSDAITLGFPVSARDSTPRSPAANAISMPPLTFNASGISVQIPE
ncbi:hypothetical protein D1AOALGA4SA_4415 [Olavius algarvensis Delta 1 endosymbiont]|nr:hypothetical protein D1AOALGA4SA_4415 [Olavius algarvensis Delta 1 endosymbiont]